MVTVWVSHDVDESEVQKIVQMVLCITAAIVTALVLLVYVGAGKHRRVTGSLTCKRLMCDFFMLAAYAVLFQAGLGDRALVDGQPTLIFWNCKYTAPVPCFFGIASVLWFGVIMWDAVSAIRTPFVFRNTARTRWRYSFFVYGYATGAIIACFWPPNDGYWEVGTEWGSNNSGQCGVAARTSGISLYYVFLFLVPCCCVVLLSLYLLRQARKSLRAGSRRTMLKRNQQLARLSFHIIVFSVYYIVGVVLLLVRWASVDATIDLDDSDAFDQHARHFGVAVCVYYSLRGLLINPLLLTVDLGVSTQHVFRVSTCVL